MSSPHPEELAAHHRELMRQVALKEEKREAIRYLAARIADASRARGEDWETVYDRTIVALSTITREP